LATFAPFLRNLIMKIQILFALSAFFSISSFVQSQTPITTFKPESGISLTQNNNLSTDDQVNNILISFGEKLNSNIISISDIEEYSWKITNGDSFNIHGIGKQIMDVLFEIPGEYNVELNHTEKTNTKACNHSSESIFYRLKVLDSKYEFLFDELSLSKSITGNVESKGLTLTIPVIYSCYFDKPGDSQGLKMISSGVNTSIIGEVVGKDTPLQVGKNLISFNLSGKATSNTYIMFDFYNQDNLIQTYYIPNVIK
jgi:hypothetical protein